MGKKPEIKTDEAIRNLLMLSLLKADVNMKLIEEATGLDEKTIYKKFPARLFKNSERKRVSRKKK